MIKKLKQKVRLKQRVKRALESKWLNGLCQFVLTFTTPVICAWFVIVGWMGATLVSAHFGQWAMLQMSGDPATTMFDVYAMYVLPCGFLMVVWGCFVFTCCRVWIKKVVQYNKKVKGMMK